MTCPHCTQGYVQDAGFQVCNHCHGTGSAPHQGRSLLRILWHLLLLALAVLYAVSCTVTIGPDGAKSFHLDGTQAARAIEILSEK